MMKKGIEESVYRVEELLLLFFEVGIVRRNEKVSETERDTIYKCERPRQMCLLKKEISYGVLFRASLFLGK